MQVVDAAELLPDDRIMFGSLCVGRVVDVGEGRIKLHFFGSGDVSGYTHIQSLADLIDGKLPDDKVLRSMIGIIPSRLSFARLNG